MGDIPRARAAFERYALAADFEASFKGDAIAWQTRLWLTRATMTLALAEDRQVQALEAAQRFESLAAHSERRLLRAASALLTARAQACLGEQLPAREAVERALALTIDARAARPFLDAGAEVVGLVRQHARSGAHATARWAAQIVDNNACLELLTARQRDILELLALRRTTKEIARDLGLSPETVKHHLKIIFERLGVSSRDEAVATARQRRRSAG
jgi:LuxR family maltose regulon positive regulatory protein